MYCGKCGKEVSNTASFCPSCGNKINVNENNNINNVTNINNMNNGMNNNIPNNMPNNIPNNFNNGYNMNYNVSNSYNPNINPNYSVTSKKKSNAPLIIGVSVLALIVIFVSVFVVFSGNDSYDDNVNDNGSSYEEDYDDGVLDSRTIMIYLCGSDLESRIALATEDLSSIDVNEIDLDTTNIVVYTGGAKKWYNFVSSQENAIYVLEENGFVKKESYNKQSMGDSDSLSELFDYAYDNYKADKYDLIMWNHGLGALGISSDEQFLEDYLNLNEITEALENSNFKGNNKLETVIFRSCLNSTLEMASIFVPYANYFVASEELTYGGYNGLGVFDFLNDVTLEDSGIDFGKKFISNYEDSLDVLAKRQNMTLDEAFPVSTYAIIDLSKVDELENKLGMFFSSLNLDLNYNTIARVRSNLYQYAAEAGCSDYDTVDLYQLVNGLKSLSSSKGESVLNLLDSVVVYNWSNNDFSKGLAIYFPYNSGNYARTLHYNNYKNLNGLNDYYSFIQRFDSLQSSSSGGGFSVISKDDIKISIENKKLFLELHDEDVDNYAKASYIIFNKIDGYYKPVFTSDTFELSKSSYSMDLDMNLIEVFNSMTNLSSIVSIKTNRFNNYYTDVELFDADGSINAKIYFNVDDDVSISKVIMSSTTSASGMYLDLKDYSTINFKSELYSVLVNNQVNDKWEESSYMTLSNLINTNSEYKFKKITLDSNYYVMFKIYDVDNLYTYSDLIQIK